MKTYRLISFLLLSMIFCQQSNAQSKKVYAGFVVTTDGDTVHGKIKMQSPSLNEVKVKFVTKKRKNKTYQAKELQSYSFKIMVWNKDTRKHDPYWVTYVKKTVERAPIAFGPHDVLVLQKQPGKIKLYHHFVEHNANRDEPLGRIQYVEKEDSGFLEITKKNYKRLLKEMTADYTDLQAKVGTKGFGFNQVEKIIFAYNQWYLLNGEEELSF